MHAGLNRKVVSLPIGPDRCRWLPTGAGSGQVERDLSGPIGSADRPGTGAIGTISKRTRKPASRASKNRHETEVSQKDGVKKIKPDKAGQVRTAAGSFCELV